MLRIGCVADDYTGASDVATGLSRAGHRTTLLFGAPGEGAEVGGADAVVVALKIRTAPAEAAVRAAVGAHDWLAERGAGRIYFKYCSTFDSTEAGNIGPVADALATATGTPLTVVCPAAPGHGRTVYQGHLFVGARLLSETSMRDHPLTPMRDSSVVRLLARQTGAEVALVPHEFVRSGVADVAERLSRLRWRGVRHAVVDAVSQRDLRTIADAAEDMRLVTGSAGLAPHLPPRPPRKAVHEDVPLPGGRTAVLAGSCSAATLEQVARASRALPSYRLDPRAAPDADELLGDCLRWLDGHAAAPAVMLYSSASAGERSAEHAPAVERVLASVARHLVEDGVRRLVVAGGETSGAVLDALEVRTCTVGPEEATGVPWLVADGDVPLALLLKSGNFGDPNLLVRAARREP